MPGNLLYNLPRLCTETYIYPPVSFISFPLVYIRGWDRIQDIEFEETEMKCSEACGNLSGYLVEGYILLYSHQQWSGAGENIPFTAAHPTTLHHYLTEGNAL